MTSLISPTDASNSLEVILRIGEILSILGGGVLVAFKLGRSTQSMEAAIGAQALSAVQQKDEISQLKIEVRKLSDIMTHIAVQNTRMDTMAERVTMLDQRFEELRHGEGFIYPLSAHLQGGIPRK
jgi:hypothetical protein